MDTIIEYLKACKTFYVATVDGEQPHVRPFGAICKFEDKLYIVTNQQKKVFAQLMSHSKIEICGMNKNTWMRIEGDTVLDQRAEARDAMLSQNSSLSSLYSFDDEQMEVFYIKDMVATRYSFTEEPKRIAL